MTAVARPLSAESRATGDKPVSNLVAVLERSQAQLDRFRKEGLKETPTRIIFVDPILAALGWDVRDPDEVQLEYPTVDGKSVDYAMKLNRKPVLLVEAKGLNDSLGDVKDVTQTTGYAANDGIVWCILTNGVRWRVYRSVEQCPAPEKLMFEVSFDPADLEGVTLAQVAERFQRFSREQMAKGTLDALGEQTFTDGKVRKAVHHLVTDPPNVLLKLVRRATGDPALKPQTIRESLGRILLPLLGSQLGVASRRETPTESGRKQGARKPSITRRTKRDVGYSQELHTKGKPQEVLELYQRLDQFCLALKPGAVEKRYLAKYVAYSESKRIFCCIHLYRGGLRVWVKLKFQRIANPPAFARDVSAIGHWGVGDVELAISNTQELNDAESFIRQSFVEA
jgi:predicted transport protein